MIVLSSNALAWGQRERDVLHGLIIGSVITHQHQRPYQPPYVPPPLPQYIPQQIPQYIPPPPPTICVQTPVFDQYNGRFYGYELKCR